MRNLVAAICALGMFTLAAFGANPKSSSSSNDRNSMVIVFKDGHKETIPVADIANIEFTTLAPTTSPTAAAVIPSRNHFVGKWEVGEGTGSVSTFFITLEANGDARKSIGAAHGSWTLVDGEARITWDDGWHDAIRKVGTKHEKFAYEPGKSFSDEPSNVTAARNTQPKPL